MKAWIPAFAGMAMLASAAHAPAAEQHFMDGTRLLSYCEETERQGPKVNTFRAGYCLAFVEGTLKGWEAGALVRSAPLNYCFPPGTKFETILATVIKHLRGNPSELGGKAELLVISAVQKAYPCAPAKR